MPIADHAHCSKWFTAANIAAGTVWDTMLTEVQPDGHEATANYLYADGHVETIAATIIAAWAAAGTNFAKPQ
jgi:prepilin-type processing-associated H-X9-DG protein